MKQHITTEQLNELSEERLGMLSVDSFKWGSGISCPLLSIGQMIEFLESAYPKHQVTKRPMEREVEKSKFTRIDKYDESWHEGSIWKFMKPTGKPLDGWVVIGEGKELCDALWEAVKEVLAKEE